jgi:hypothetical protein
VAPICFGADASPFAGMADADEIANPEQSTAARATAGILSLRIFSSSLFSLQHSAIAPRRSIAITRM